jgi:hypothetical protein
MVTNGFEIAFGLRQELQPHQIAFSAIPAILGFQAIKDLIFWNPGATGQAHRDRLTQGLQLGRLFSLALFEQTQPSAHHFADIVEAPRFDLLADEGFEVGAERNTGWHRWSSFGL